MQLFNNDKWQIAKIDLKTANEFVSRYHRHHTKVVGHKFSVGASCEDILVGIAICGRPVSRKQDNGKTLEINRLCTTGVKNTCSKLCSYVMKYAKLKGYERVITYTLMSENGASLKASNFILDKINAGGVSWTTNTDKNRKYQSNELKKRWKYLIKQPSLQT